MEPIAVTDDKAFDRELVLNNSAYETLREQLRRDYGQQYVGIALGRLIAVDPDFDKVADAIWTTVPRPQHCILYRADQEAHLEPYESLSVDYS